MPAQPLQKQYEEKIKKLAADFEFFAHLTSHDLRDPLRQARIYSNELLEKLEGAEKQKLIQINEQVDLVLNKIALLREYSYIAASKGDFATVDLNVVIKEVLYELADKIKLTGAEIKTGNFPIINGNPKHLKKLFLALIDNAIKFRIANEKLHVSIEATQEKNFWHFIISDNGIGLEEVYRELVFVLFQRLDNEAKNESLGAGLAFAKKIVENHGGKIWYKSDGESGTEFHFTLAK